MTYNIEKLVDSYGKDKARNLIVLEGYSQIELQNALGIKSTKRLHAAVYSRLYEYLNISDIPYKADKPEIRKLKLEFDKYCGNYWESEYIVDFISNKLLTPIFNKAGSTERYVISFPKHPKANPLSNQVKAHIVLWELYNEQYVPEDSWVMPIDGSYLNLDINNYILVNKSVYKSKSMLAENNPAYKHGLALRPKLGGWSKISKNYLEKHTACTICTSKTDLLVHHIINYHLFNDPFEAHSNINLMCLCRSCHTSLHAHNTSIKAHIEATQYSKLLELLETLKSQVSESNIEIYYDVEKQLGLTDNQQPSP